MTLKYNHYYYKLSKYFSAKLELSTMKIKKNQSDNVVCI